MTKQAFTVHGGIYEHVMDVAGTETGVELKYQPWSNVNDLFAQMLAKQAFEVCEFSLANYLTLRAAGHDWLTAIPVFPNRAFRHGTLTVKRESSLTSPRQLNGLRIGVEDYSMTAAIWVRGLLEDEYGVDLSSLTWVSGKSQRFTPPSSAKVEFSDTGIETLLLEGKVDVIVGLNLADAKKPARERQLRSILAEPEMTERTYYERTGIYPINHCVVVRRDALENCPDLPEAVARAYLRAKSDAYKTRLGATLVPWGKSYWSQIFEIFGGDPLPYGLTATNRTVVSTLAKYLAGQGFGGDGHPDFDKLFLCPPALSALAAN